MHLTNFQNEIEERLKNMQVDVLIALFERVEELDDDVLAEYRKLILVYTHCRIYKHKLKKWIDEYAGMFTSGTYHHYNRQLREQEKLAFLLDKINSTKHHLRDRMQEKGINFKKYHPHLHRLDIDKIPLYHLT